MKKTITKSPVTEEKLKEVLKDYPTKTNVEEMELRIDERSRQYRDEILTRLDGVMGELEQIRENGVFTDHDIKVLKDKSDEHEKRIKKLETS